MKEYKLNPGDLGFLFGKCRCCYWNKVVNGVVPPSHPIPNLLLNLDKIIKEHLSGKNLRELGDQFPDGIVTFTNQKTISTPIKGSKGDIALIINGVFPLAYKLPGGSYGLALVKTSDVLDEYIPFYWLQLMAYVCALEHSAQEGFNLDITEIGIISYTPRILNDTKLIGEFEWKDFEIDKGEYNKVMAEIMKLLRGEMPEASEDCAWCRYVKNMSSDKRELAHA